LEADFLLVLQEYSTLKVGFYRGGDSIEDDSLISDSISRIRVLAVFSDDERRING